MLCVEQVGITSDSLHFELLIHFMWNACLYYLWIIVLVFLSLTAVVKYGESILVVGGEDDKSWMAGLFMLKEEEDSGRQYWAEGQELPVVLSTFAHVTASVPSELIHADEDL